MESKQIENKIFAYWERIGTSEPARRYLGASIIGHECERYLWLYFRGAFVEDFGGRMYRLFERGRREEETFTRELRGIGSVVWDRDPATHQQWAVSAYGGLFGGHLDGMARNVPGLPPEEVVVVEFKTHSDKSFTKLQREGVRESKPMHYAQMTVYMGTEGKKHALYLAVNKNTDDLYAEIIEFNQKEFETLLLKSYRVITSKEALPRSSNRPDFWTCKYCPAHSACWGCGNACAISPDRMDCRSCVHACADTKTGKWVCDLGNAVKIGEKVDCARHMLLPGLIPGALPVDGSPEFVKYKTPKGREFVAGKDGFSSVAICTMSLDELTDPDVADSLKALKDAGFKIRNIRGCGTGAGLSLNDRFPRNRCKVLWFGKESEWVNQFGETWEITSQEIGSDGVIRYEIDGDKLLCISHERKQAYILYREGRIDA